MSQLTRILRRARLSLRYASIGRVLRRTGLTKLVREVYVRRVLKQGQHEARVMGQVLKFRVDFAKEIVRVDTIEKELEFLERISAAIRDGDHVFDVGANLGTVSLLLAKLKPDAHIFAFEPEPQNAARLRENVLFNDAGNVEVLELALAAEDGTLTLHVLGETGTGSHSLVDDMGGGGETAVVKTIRGEHFVSECGRAPHVMKIDVEGAELQVLEGFAGVLSDSALHDVFVEVHPEKLRKVGATPGDVEQVMMKHGFELVWSKQRGGEEHRHYRKKTTLRP